MKKPTLSQAETDEMVRWAAKDQSALGLDVITDGEAYRENMYYFYQKRVDGVTFENMPRLAFGDAGFGIECPRVVGPIENQRFNLAHNWRLAREAAPTHVRVKQTVTGPHVLTRFSVNERKDLYPDDKALCRAWAAVLGQALQEVIAAGCREIQFDEPMWTEAPRAERVGRRDFSMNSSANSRRPFVLVCTSAAATPGASGSTSPNTWTSRPPSAKSESTKSCSSTAR